jgi:hypothetical protein
VGTHLTDEQIGFYRKLPAQELFVVDDHLAVCEECRNRLAESQQDRIETVNPYLFAPEPDHLLFEQLKAYVDGSVDQTDQEIVESHLSLCSQCAEDEADLRKIRADLTGYLPRNKPSFASQALLLWRSPEYSLPFRTALAAAVVFLILLATLFYRSSNNEIQGKWKQALAENQALKEKVQELEKTKVSAPVETPQKSTLLVSLRDGSGRIEMDQSGMLYGVDSYPPAYHDKIQAVLKSGSLSYPRWFDDLGQRAEIVRGEQASVSGPFRVLSPVGVVELSDHPQFQWSSCPGASQYQLKVYDNKFRVVAFSPKLDSLSWSPSAPLNRGEIYSWQVVAFTSERTITVPLAPAPEAKFKVLEEQKMRELEQIKTQNPNAHLLMATFYAENGMVVEARKELEELKKTNPDSVFAQKLVVQ